MRFRPMLLAALALAVTAFTPPEPKRPSGLLKLHADEALTKLWAIWTVSATGGPDSVVVTITASGAADVRRKYTVTPKTDSVDVVYPAAGASKTVTATAIAYKFGKPSTAALLGSGTVVGEVPAPTGTLKLTPAKFTVDADSASVCQKWQAANPTKSPFILVNATAVPACQGPVGPRVAQFCTIHDPGPGGTPSLATPLPARQNELDYCTQALASYIATRSV